MKAWWLTTVFLLALFACSQSAPATDCAANPLANPQFEIEGADLPDDGHVRLNGVVDEVVRDGGLVEIVLVGAAAEHVRVQMNTDEPVEIDLAVGSEVGIDYWDRAGFEGTARGLRITDDAGVVLIADDGDYGNAIDPTDLAPFAVAQADAGCRNRENRPGDINNFSLVVAVGDDSVRLLHGDQGSLAASSSDYTVSVFRSVAAVDGVIWTDAPTEHISFLIARVPDD